MTGNGGRTRLGPKRTAKTASRKVRDRRNTPEYRRHCKRYGTFLKKYFPPERIDQLLEELGI